MKDEAPNGIKRGHNVECQVTGITGICAGFSEHVNGSFQVSIIPKTEKPNEKASDYYWVDYHCVKIIDDGITQMMEPMDDDIGINLGAFMTDQITRTRGYVTEKLIALNGCISVKIEGADIVENGLPVPKWFDQHRLIMDVVGEDINVGKSTTRGGAPSSWGRKG